ncbi:hypothetical protein [Streptomyces sp. FIT100]|uniref:hypothetical protein n=1 Tax=Streptomyces sp. FIT100 TaxID=2837956 RepID=UPI0021C666E0|nr:hypothetical protein [Streptomyces sp. FIT100]UUN29689.1 hypothetical protein KK483_27435 [Streptomyces sp. FIT100]
MNTQRAHNQALKSLLAEAGWTQEALARSVNLTGREIGLDLKYDRTAVAHWLAGARPRPPITVLLAETFTRRLRRPVTPFMLGLASSPAHGGPTTHNEATAAEALSELSTAELDPRRREALAQDPYHVPRIGAFDPLGPLGKTDGGTRQADDNGGQRVGTSHVLALRTAVDSFAVLVDSIGGSHGRTALAALLADAVSTWLRARSTAAIQAQLFTSAAHLALLLARMHLDNQAQGLAQRYLATSLRLALEADDRSTSAIALRMMSAQAHGLGHHPEALDLAQSAARTASAAPAPVHAYVLAQLAVAQAAGKDRNHALASLRKAERLAEPTGSPPGPFNSYPPSALAYQQAETLGQLGDHRAAVSALTTSAGHRPPNELRARALTRAQLAQKHLHLGHLDASCDTWQLFLDDYPHLGSGKADDALRTLRRQLAPHRRYPPAEVILTRAYTLTSRRLDRA